MITVNKAVVFWQYSGVYGIVLRVKILFNKKDTALVQFADPVQAQNGKAYLYFRCYARCLLQRQKGHSASEKLLMQQCADNSVHFLRFCLIWVKSEKLAK